MSAASAATASVGRLNVGMPTVTRLVSSSGWCLDRRIPSGGDDFGVGVGGEVEPDPAAVLERAEVDFEFDAAAAGFVDRNQFAADTDARTVELGAVQVDPAGADHLHAQHHRLQDRPPSPVGGGEGVEVRLEADLRIRAQHNGSTAR